MNLHQIHVFKLIVFFQVTGNGINIALFNITGIHKVRRVLAALDLVVFHQPVLGGFRVNGPFKAERGFCQEGDRNGRTHLHEEMNADHQSVFTDHSQNGQEILILKQFICRRNDHEQTGIRLFIHPQGSVVSIQGTGPLRLHRTQTQNDFILNPANDLQAAGHGPGWRIKHVRKVIKRFQNMPLVKQKETEILRVCSEKKARQENFGHPRCIVLNIHHVKTGEKPEIQGFHRV